MSRFYVHNNILRSENINLQTKFKTSTPILITKYFTSLVSERAMENCWKISHVRKERLGLRDLVRWKSCFLDSGRFV